LKPRKADSTYVAAEAATHKAHSPTIASKFERNQAAIWFKKKPARSVAENAGRSGRYKKHDRVVAVAFVEAARSWRAAACAIENRTDPLPKSGKDGNSKLPKNE
jgi:hypothetical protein